MKLLFRIDIDKWEEIFQAISKNKTRSILTAFGIFWGIFMLVFLLGGGNGLKAMLTKNFEGFAQNAYFLISQTTTKPFKGFKKGRKWNLTLEDAQALRKEIPQINHLTPLIAQWSLPISYKDRTTRVITTKGVFPDYSFIETLELSKGRYIIPSDISEQRKVCVLGKELVEELFKNEDPIGKNVKIDQTYYTVIGVDQRNSGMGIMGPASQTATVPYTTLQNLYNFGNKVIILGITLKPEANVEHTNEKILALIKNRHQIAPNDDKAISTFSLHIFYQLIKSLFDGINILVFLIGIGTLIAGAIGVSNIMMVTVSERTVEIGIRRAIGAKPKDILSEILTESIVLTILAGLLGISFATLLLTLIEKILRMTGTNVSFQISFDLAVFAALLLAILGALAGILPALRALSIKPIDALSDE